MKTISTIPALFIAIFFSFVNTNAQVTIAPTNLFIAENARFGTYMVINNSNETQEISVDFAFSYSTSDEMGYRSIVQDDEELEAQYSIADDIRAFPRNFTLAPGQRQVVRLRLSPSADLPDGTYWARIKTASNPETPPLELQAENTVAARVGIKVEQVTGIFYKKGNTTTGIEINEIQTQYDEATDNLVVLVDHARLGNSPFLGSISTTVIDQNGQELRTGFLSTSIYFDGIFRQEFEIPDLEPGNYTIRVTFETERSDISITDLVQMKPVTGTSTFTMR